VRGRPKRKRVRRIRPESADRRNLICSMKAFCDSKRKQEKRGGSLHMHSAVSICPPVIVVYPCNMKEDEKRVHLNMTRWDEEQGCKRVDHTEKLKCELRARGPDDRNLFPVPDSKGG